ncbi:hypothetical protein EJB05_20744, partial [Eragrostis curvula]
MAGIGTTRSRFLVIFHNGSDHEIDLTHSGIPSVNDFGGNKILWTFRGRFRLKSTFKEDVTKADVYLTLQPRYEWVNLNPIDLVDTEATEVALYINSDGITPNTVSDCWFYLSYLSYNKAFIEHDKYVHACNYWVCEGIIKGGHTWEAAGKLSEEMRLEYFSFGKLWETFISFPWNRERLKRWISVTSTDNQTIPPEATSCFLTLQEPERALPKEIFHQSKNLRVIKLSSCSFSFQSPPFLYCSNLRFIWIDRCKDSESTIGPVEKKCWTCLQRLWVLDIRHTNWTWILSPEMMELMTNLRELNVKAVGSSDWNLCITTLKSKWLHTIHMLRITESSMYLKLIMHDFVAKIGKLLELLDLSGNASMDVLPNLSGASKLKVLILDGCDGLEIIEPTILPVSLESFSFDGFGPALSWKHSVQIPERQMRPSTHTDKDEVHPRVSKISLKGCTHLKSVFLRGLPKLKDLDLSETAIEALDLQAMQTEQLDQILLLGCDNLRSVQWHDSGNSAPKLLCVDTREKGIRSMDNDREGFHSCFGIQKDSSLPHARIVTTDARFLKSFYNFFVEHNSYHVHLSSTVGHVHVKETQRQKEICPIDGSLASKVPGLSTTAPYVDILEKFVKKDSEDVLLVKASMQLLPAYRYVEIAEGGCLREKLYELYLSTGRTIEYLHVHDHLSITTVIQSTTLTDSCNQFQATRCCRVERCPKLHTVFLLDYIENSFNSLESLWVSHLPQARCIWSRNLKFQFYYYSSSSIPFEKLRYVHLHSCPNLEFVLPCSTLPSLEIICITHCGELRQIFLKGEHYKREHRSTPLQRIQRIARFPRITHRTIGRTFPAGSIQFPRLRKIHFHELPKLQQICEADMPAPMLGTIKLRACWSLRRLPAIHRGRTVTRPAEVDCEKDWWDNLRWDGLEASRPLYRPHHSSYYRESMLKGTVLRSVPLPNCSSSA